MDVTYLAVPIFFFIAILFSMLGLGGGLLYIPILFWLGMDLKKEAIPLGMLLNVVNGATAVLTYARRHFINWRLALPFGLAMVAMAPVGALVNAYVPQRPLLALVAFFIAAAAALMLSRWKPDREKLDQRNQTLLGLSAGSVLGLVAGLAGLGGGVFVMPLLYVAGLPPQSAAATTALVVTGSGLSGFVSHLILAATPRWGLWLACAASVFAGSEIGSHYMSRQLDPERIQSVFGVVLMGVAVVLVIKDILLP